MIAETRSNSAFANLSPEDHAKILHWLSRRKLADVKALLAKPRPEGLAIKTSTMSLSRYKRKFLNDYVALLHDCGTLPTSPFAFNSKPRSNAELKSETLTSLRHRLFEASINPSIDPSKLHALACTFEKINKGDAPKTPKREIDPAEMLLSMLAQL